MIFLRPWKVVKLHWLSIPLSSTKSCLSCFLEDRPAMDSELFNGSETVCASRWPLIIANQYYLRGSSGINSRNRFVQPLCGWPIFCSSIWSCMSSVRERHDDLHSSQAIWCWRPVGDSRRAKQAARMVPRMQSSSESKEDKGDDSIINSDVKGTWTWDMFT